MKKILSLILVTVMMFASVPSVLAADSNDIEIYVDGVAVQNMDVDPFIENGRTLVPLRAVAEAMGAEVLWDQATQTVSLKKFAQRASYKSHIHNAVKEDGTIVPIYGTGMANNVNMVAKLVIGNNEITIGLDRVIDYIGGPVLSSTAIYSETKKMDVTAVIVNDRTFIPARFVGYALGYDVSWNDELRRVDYKYVERQTIDFDIQEEKDTPKIDYDYDKEKYPDVTTVYDKAYPSRKGYEDIVIIDTSVGKYENGKMVNLVPYKFIQNNYIIESDEKKYDISNDKTPEENLQAFKNFYEDKVRDEVIVKKYDNGGIGLNPTYSTINDAVYLKYAPYDLLYELYYDQEVVDHIGNKKYYGVDVYYTKYDFSKYFMYNTTVTGGLQYGSKLTNGFGIDAGVHNSLLMLNEFLGETGQRIWKMMNDYYTLEGAFYVDPDTEWTKCYPGTYLMIADPIDPISDEQASEYGLNIVNRFESQKTTSQTIVIDSGKQNIYVEYLVPDISSSVPIFRIFFEYIE